MLRTTEIRCAPGASAERLSLWSLWFPSSSMSKWSELYLLLTADRFTNYRHNLKLQMVWEEFNEYLFLQMTIHTSLNVWSVILKRHPGTLKIKAYWYTRLHVRILHVKCCTRILEHVGRVERDLTKYNVYSQCPFLGGKTLAKCKSIAWGCWFVKPLTVTSYIELRLRLPRETGQNLVTAGLIPLYNG